MFSDSYWFKLSMGCLNHGYISSISKIADHFSNISKFCRPRISASRTPHFSVNSFDPFSIQGTLLSNGIYIPSGMVISQPTEDKYSREQIPSGHPKTQTMQTADRRLRTMQTMPTMQNEYFFFLILVFGFTFDSHLFLVLAAK